MEIERAIQTLTKYAKDTDDELLKVSIFTLLNDLDNPKMKHAIGDVVEVAPVGDNWVVVGIIMREDHLGYEVSDGYSTMNVHNSQIIKDQSLFGND